ncbi:MAG: MBL fold metallo-hydrolase [Actinomycetota bacterium]
MDVTVLGCGAAYPRPGGACSGFLFSSGDTHVWVDAGNGTFSRLQQVISYGDIAALVLTHGHADHVADVLPLMYALGFDPVTPVAAALPVYAPVDVETSLKWPLGGRSLEMFKSVFEFRHIKEPFTFGDMRFASFSTRHPAETHGLRVSVGDRSVVYTSDTALYPELADDCRDADVLICEATYVDGVEAAPGVHLWARQAGQVARDAGAKRLILSHIWSTFDPEQAVREAAEEYDGPVEAAAEGKRYTV